MTVQVVKNGFEITVIYNMDIGLEKSVNEPFNSRIYFKLQCKSIGLCDVTLRNN